MVKYFTRTWSQGNQVTFRPTTPTDQKFISHTICRGTELKNAKIQLAVMDQMELAVMDQMERLEVLDNVFWCLDEANGNRLLARMAKPFDPVMCDRRVIWSCAIMRLACMNTTQAKVRLVMRAHRKYLYPATNTLSTPSSSAARMSAIAFSGVYEYANVRRGICFGQRYAE